jgi:phosphosulfolactate synthase (CoM biosynthesis protein A)
VSQLEADHAGYNSLEAEIIGDPGSITESNTTVRVVSTHHGISHLKINRILWESKGNCHVSQHSTTVTFSDLILSSSLLS